MERRKFDFSKKEIRTESWAPPTRFTTRDGRKERGGGQVAAEHATRVTFKKKAGRVGRRGSRVGRQQENQRTNAETTRVTRMRHVRSQGKKKPNTTADCNEWTAGGVMGGGQNSIIFNILSIGERLLFSTHSHNFQHFLPRYITISIQIIHAKCPFKFLLQFPSGCNWQSAEKLPKIYSTVTVGIERPEHVFSEFRCVPVREEVPVDLLELVHAEVAAGAVFQEPLVPLLDLRIWNRRKPSFRAFPVEEPKGKDPSIRCLHVEQGRVPSTTQFEQKKEKN